MSDYKTFDLEEVRIARFVNIEHGTKYVSLSIHTGKEFEEAVLTPNQAIEIANELIKRAETIKRERKS